MNVTATRFQASVSWVHCKHGARPAMLAGPSVQSQGLCRKFRSGYRG